MNKFWIGACAAGIAVAAAAQGVNIYLDVKRLSSTKSSAVRSQGYYHEDKDYSRSVALGVMVKNMSQNAATVNVEWYFVAKTLQWGKRWIYDSGTQTVDLAKTAFTNLTVASADVGSSKSQTWWYQEQTGSKYEGYVVRIKSGGHIAAVKASSRPMETLGRNERELTDMLKAAEEAMKKYRGNTDR